MSAAKQPLRAALIGLSSTSVTSWAATAHLPGLLTPAGRSKYTITALLNSTAESAKNAIKVNNFPESTKAYGSPEELAADPDIDVVICSTRVDHHYSTILPAIKAGKDVYVEWPVASNLKDIREIVEESKKSGSRVAAGMQRRWIPQVAKIREIIREGKLGKVLSSQASTYGGTQRRDSLVEGLKYFADRKVGGNVITIGVGHTLDLVLSAIGRLDLDTVKPRMQIQRPEVKLRDPKTGNTTGTVKSDVADFLSFHGILESSAYTAPGATLSFDFRAGPAFPGAPAFVWSIALEHGEIRLVSPSGSAMEFGPEPVKIQVHYHESDKVEDVSFDWGAEEEGVRPVAKAVRHCLYAFADGKPETEGWVGVEDAEKHAELIESLFAAQDRTQV